MKQQLGLWASRTSIKAVKTFAQALASLAFAGAVNVINVPWTTDLGLAAGAAVACVLHNINSIPEPKGK